MQKIQMQIFGKTALVDADQVKKHATKQLYVVRIRALQEDLLNEADPLIKQQLSNSLNDIARLLKNLNRGIRKNVQFI